MVAYSLLVNWHFGSAAGVEPLTSLLDGQKISPYLHIQQKQFQYQQDTLAFKKYNLNFNCIF